MKNLHKTYYKDYFSLQDVSINNVNRHLDYELLIDDTKKHQLENQVRTLEGQKKTAQRYQREQIEAQITEIKAQITVNANVLTVRNNVLTGHDYTKKDQKGRPTRELLKDAIISNEVAPKDDNNRFSLEIQYPGLVTGVGIDHETKIEGEFKLGVHFDWTWGMPVVYGSSVKGVIRSAFTDGYVVASLIERANAKKGINESDKVPAWVGDDANEQAIIDGIFEGKDSNGKNLSIYDRDIFFDAVITEADPKGRILCSDSITPHGDNPLKNPIPITFMKIAPGCKLEFRFKLHDSDLGGGKIFTAAQKKTLFEEILKTVGVGAKTNVGYGQLK